MTKKEFLEQIKDAPDDAKLKFGYGLYRPEQTPDGHTTFIPLNRKEITKVRLTPKRNIIFPVIEVLGGPRGA